MKIFYHLRSSIVVKKFKSGKDYKILVSILDKILDIYESIKYRKMFKKLDNFVNEQEDLADELAVALDKLSRMKK